MAQRLDANGQVVSADLYDAYGMRLDPPDIDDADPYGWGAQWGYYRDQSLGLVLMTHRYYDPQTGRFLTRDPIGYAGGVNLYAYCRNNPVNLIDPLGLCAEAFNWLDKIQLGLDVAGLVPGLGEAADLTNGLISLANRDYDDAALSFAAMIPFVGAAATTGKLVNKADDVVDAARALNHCFVAGTPVAMANGTTKPIEQVKEGDLVLSRDEHDDESGAIVAKRVAKTFVHQAPATLTLTLSTGEVIETTGEHPFYVSGTGFVEAKDLGIGTSLVTRAGPAVQVVGIERRARAAAVYNFTVEGTHTYFVGATNGGVWAHNKRNDFWGNPSTLNDHFARHGDDVGATNADDYSKQASNFLVNSQRSGFPTKIDPSDGTIRVYDPNTNTFGAYNADGTVKTLFKPSRPTYFDDQTGSLF